MREFWRWGRYFVEKYGGGEVDPVDALQAEEQAEQRRVNRVLERRRKAIAELERTGLIGDF